MSKPSFIIGYISFIWIYSFANMLPISFGLFGKYEFNRTTMECDMSKDQVPRIVALVVHAAIPVVLIFILYILIFIKVKQSSHLVAASMRRQTSNTTNDSDTELTSMPLGAINNDTNNSILQSSSRRQSSIRSLTNIKRKLSESSLHQIFARQDSRSSQNIAVFRRDTKVGRTIFIIFIVIITCSIPVIIAHSAEAKSGKVENKSQFLLLHILYWVQYCANIFVYVIFNQQYRNAYIECLALIEPKWSIYMNKKFFWERDVSLKQEKKCKPIVLHTTPKNSISFSENEKEVFLPPKSERLSAVLEAQSREDLTL